MIRQLITAIALTYGLSGPASAGPVPGTATLAAPADIGRIVTDAGVWQCSGNSCTGSAESVTGIAVAACTAVADTAGRVTAFTAGSTNFGEAELSRCNRHIRK